MEISLSEQATDEISTCLTTFNDRLEPFLEGERKDIEKKST
jgi:hypothetical protein